MTDLSQLKPGQVVVINGKSYGRCADCDGIVRIDKWLIGSVHLCNPPSQGSTR